MWQLRDSALALLAIAIAVAAAGCGGSKTPSVAGVATTTSSIAAGASAAGSASTPGATQPEEAGLKYARCMRANGEPNFPDPNGGGGFTFSAGSGVDPSSPLFKAAAAKCQKFMDLGGGLAPGTQTHPSAQWLAKMEKVAQCMRRHGVPNFPDPTTTVPSPSALGGNGLISNIDGAVFVFGSTIDRQSPLFARAANGCSFPLRNH